MDLVKEIYKIVTAFSMTWQSKGLIYTYNEIYILFIPYNATKIKLC